MDTNTIIELFEELREQPTTLSRRIDDRNISAPASAATDDKIAQLLETTQFTHTNVERARMELTDRITTIEKETESHTEKIIAAIAHPAQPAAQRHIHVIDFNTSWALLYMAISFVVILCGGIHITKLYDRIANLRDTELKYRYVQMMGGIDEQKLRDLNALFYDSERHADRRSLRQQVEHYEKPSGKQLKINSAVLSESRKRKISGKKQNSFKRNQTFQNNHTRLLTLIR